MAREIFVLESNGEPKRGDVAITRDDIKRMEIAIELGVRVGIPVGQERITRYVPEGEQMWLFQANKDWTQTQLTNTAPAQPLLQNDVDGKPWTFSLCFSAPNWDEAKRLMDEMQGFRVGTSVEHVAPGPKWLKERRGNKLTSKYKPGKPKHRWNWLKFDDPRYARWAVRSGNIESISEIKVCKRCGQVVRMVRERCGADRHKMVREHLKMDSDITAWLRGNKVCTK